MSTVYNPSQVARYAMIVALGGLLFGYDASVISGVIGFITPEFGLTDFQIGLVVGAPSLAGIVSGLSAGPISDVIGRKRMLLILALLYTASAILSALAPSYEVLVFARFLGGFAFASLGIAPLYIGEMAPSERRGYYVSFNQFAIMLGFSVAYFTNYFVLQASQSDASWVVALGVDQNTWRWMLGLEIIPAFLWFLMLFQITESPRWLVLKGRVGEARDVLSRLRPANRVEQTVAQIHESVKDVGLPLLRRIGEIFGKPMRLPILIGVIIAVVQQVTGINAIYFYAPSIFEQSGVGTNAAFAQATLIGIINIVFTILAMYLIDKLGRKPLLIIGLLGIILSMSVAGYGFSQATYRLSPDVVASLPADISRDDLGALINIEYSDDLSFKDAARKALGEDVIRQHQASLIQHSINVNPMIVLIGILGFVASFAFSLGPVMWVLFSEIFPNRARGVALGFVSLFNSMSSFAVQFFFPWQLNNLGNVWTFFIYAIFGVIGLLLILWLLPETRGKSLEQIERDFQR